jgi:ABC-type lipoprotein release transport system permease subunit
MARSPSTVTPSAATRRRRRALIPPSVTLAAWRLRQMWGLLLIAALGNIAAVLLVCIVPLFTQVSLAAGLRQVLTGQGGAQIVVNGFGAAPNRQNAMTIQSTLDQIIASDVGPYTHGAAQLSLGMLLQLPPQQTAGGSNTSGSQGGQVQIQGADPGAMTSAYKVVEGRLPGTASGTLEIALSQDDARLLGADVGTILHTALPAQQPLQVDLRVVGIVTPSPADILQAQQQFGGGGFGVSYSSSGGPNLITPLASNDAIFSTFGNVQWNPQSGPPPNWTWAYPLDITKVNAGTLNDLLGRLSRAQNDVPSQLGNSNGMQGIYLQSGAYQALVSFRTQILVLQIPLLLLLLQVLALVLLFVRMIADMLVERQADAIATVRSRGATRRQVLNAFTVHNLGLALLALVVGPLVAIPLVRYLSQSALPAASQNAANVISGNPLAVAWGLRWYILAAVVVSGFAMIFSTNRAATQNVLTLRRESARTTTKPFWQRWNLDLIFGAISILAYGGYTLAVRQVEPRIQLILSPLSVIAALIMLVAAALLFLRLLPILLGIASRFSTRGRGAASMLALTQMARAPKQPIRMTLLLALSTGFTMFTLIYGASQAQRIVDVAGFQASADFTGTLSTSASSTATLASLTAPYRQINGVTSATLGYKVNLQPNNSPSSVPMTIFAVDADTYAQSAYWTTQDSTQPLSGLMSHLTSARANAANDDRVPAIVDDATWQTLSLSPGALFTLQPPGYQNGPMKFVAVARVAHIPTVYDSAQGGGLSGAGGVLVDYQSYAAVYKQDVGTAAPAPNTAWLATRDDADSLASVRKALGSGSLALGSLADRRQLIENARNNPLQIDISNTLLIGAATALILALIGIWVGWWLNARGRVVNFAVLRALGSTPRQIRGMLAWEQIIVYLSGLVLGLVLGWVLSLTALPLLIFVELATGGNFNNVPNVPPARVIVPTSTLALALGVLVAICVLALILTMGALARLSLGQTLRLNED